MSSLFDLPLGTRVNIPFLPGQPGLRRNPPRSKAARQENSPSDNPDAFPSVAEQHQTDEDRRLVSSDLSDCEEVWIGELSDYILETHKRQRQVESWFEASVLVSPQGKMLINTYFSLVSRSETPPRRSRCRDITSHALHEYLPRRRRPHLCSLSL